MLPHSIGKHSISRRQLLKRSGGVLAGAALAGTQSGRAYADGENEIKLVPGGYQGTGDAANALSTQSPTKLLATANFFDNSLQSGLKGFSRQFPRKFEVPKDWLFVGLNAYRKATDTLENKSLVLLSTSPSFRLIHLSHRTFLP